MASYQDSHKFQLWQRNLQHNGVIIHGTKELYTKYRSDGDLLFGLFDLDATVPEGHKILPLCFVKGEVLSVLTCLIDRETQEKYLLLVQQRRICDGSYMYEHPAGMVDGSDLPLDVAVREIQEETGLVVQPAQIHQLTEKPLFPSSGTSDEAMYFFYVELELSKEEIFQYDGQTAGADHDEFILTKVVPLNEAMGMMSNACALLNIHLYLAAKKM
ncbi:NUDIX hydrolase [Siphonobacter curvatus]|uniref:GDP-mannose pyrophosphatase n=1 Tax=Siphonobacter curvatus TaxID=2094562 RepID=A0A2S7IPX2_9BACT|nr:NUDIX domain-containing protein [Siphonobacter curvatus]PQA59630.1 NUDIX hydrolase [Siphonobacter curvatus]